MKLIPTLLAVALGGAALAAQAHDTWFRPLPNQTANQGQLMLALGTGTEYPLQDTGVAAQYLVNQGCLTSGGSTATLQPVRNAPAALIVRTPKGATTCWAQLTPFEIELPAAIVPVYFQDINASSEVRAAWAGMQQRGLPWREHYTKHSRIELGGASAAAVPMGMDIRIEGGDTALRPGATLTAQVLRDGRPLAGMAVELRSEAGQKGLWSETDADGRLQVTVPQAGRWVLRGVDLHLSRTTPDEWESRFVTLAFDVPPAGGDQAAQNGSNFRLNALSTNQIAATTAISTDPPTSTARR